MIYVQKNQLLKSNNYDIPSSGIVIVTIGLNGPATIVYALTEQL